MSDLGMGLPLGDMTRACLPASTLAADLGMGDDEVADVYYTARLQHIGCTAYSHEVSALFREELAVKRASSMTNFTGHTSTVADLAEEAPEGRSGSNSSTSCGWRTGGSSSTGTSSTSSA